MKKNPYTAEMLSTIAPEEIRDYLESAGWKRIEHNPDRSSIYSNGESELFLPLRSEYLDFPLRIDELLRELAEVQHRSVQAIYTDIVQRGSDIIRIRMIDDSLADGTIPLHDFTEAANRVRELMMSAACSANEPKPVYNKRKPDIATRYVNQLRIGQSEQGSYILKMLSRIPPIVPGTGNLFDDVDELPPPFPRRVTQGLARSLQLIVRLATDGIDGNQEYAVQQGISANLCEALRGLASNPDSDRALEFSFTWSRHWPTVHEPSSPILLKPRILSVAGEFGRLLEERRTLDEFQLRGKVVKLERSETTSQGTITIHAWIENSMRQVRIELSNRDYALALKAHADGQLIECAGRLARDKQTTRLHNVVNFHIVPSNS